MAFLSPTLSCSKQLYQPVPHPYFDDWKVARDTTPQRLDAIRANVKPNERILDVVCNLGYFVRELTKDGHNVLGSDINGRIVKCARYFAEYEDIDPELIQKVDFNKVLETNHWDSILFLSIFHHMLRDDVDEAWKTLNEVSKNSDKMFIDLNENVYNWSPKTAIENTEYTRATNTFEAQRNLWMLDKRKV